MWCCVFLANRVVKAAPGGDNVRIAWQAWHFVTFQHVSQRVENRLVWHAQYLFAALSENELHFSWQAQHFGENSQIAVLAASELTPTNHATTRGKGPAGK